MAAEGSGRTRRRTPVTRERVVRAAVRLADKGGLDAVSMRKLGEALHVEAMSLYKHVAHKDDVLDGIVDAVFDEISLPAADADWRTAMRSRATSAREVLLRHPWAVGLLDSRRNPGVATLRHHDAVLGCLRRNGFPVEMAVHAFSLLDSYVYGFVLQETSLPFQTTAEAREVAETMLPESVAAAFPHVAEAAQLYTAEPAYSYAAEFEFGLDLILDGLGRSLDAGGRRPQGRPRGRATA